MDPTQQPQNPQPQPPAYPPNSQHQPAEPQPNDTMQRLKRVLVVAVIFLAVVTVVSVIAGLTQEDPQAAFEESGLVLVEDNQLSYQIGIPFDWQLEITSDELEQKLLATPEDVAEGDQTSITARKSTVTKTSDELISEVRNEENFFTGADYQESYNVSIEDYASENYSQTSLPAFRTTYRQINLDENTTTYHERYAILQDDGETVYLAFTWTDQYPLSAKMITNILQSYQET